MMKTNTAQLQRELKPDTSRMKLIVPAMAASAREILALLSAVTAATSMVLLSVWVAGQELGHILAALTWSTGLVFLGFALDGRGPSVYFLASSGLAFLVLAGLQNSVSPDFAIFSGVLSAAWTAIVVFRQLR